MSLINRQIPALYNGISQQPPTLRMPSQCEEQINVWETVVQGKMSRPPTQLVAKLTDDDLTSAYLQVINRDINEQYFVVIEDGNIRVFDIAGNERTVNFPNGKAYLSNKGYPISTWTAALTITSFNVFIRPTAANGFVFQPVAVTGVGGGTEPSWPTVEGATVVSGGITYAAWLDPVPTPLTPKTDFSATTVADYTFIVNKTVLTGMMPIGSEITAQPTTYYWLPSQLTGDQLGNYTAANGGVLAQYEPSPEAGVYQGTVQTFDDLPIATSVVPPSEGDVYLVQGDQNSAFTAYYVIRQEGVWNESVAPGLKNLPDATTMPWALVRNAGGDFTFSPFSWAPRRFGDETTNKNPSFMGRAIKDVFFNQNRLGLMSGENVIHSRAGDFGNFYRMTVLQLLADDVVDVATSETQVTEMEWAVPFATGMMMFSPETQFRLMVPTDGQLTPTTVSLPVTTRFVNSQTVRPVMLGSDVYFVSEDDSYAHIREYYVTLNYLSQFKTDADDVTAHVPKFIPKGVYLLAGSNLHDMLFLATAPFPNRLYVYKFYWQSEEQKGQSAWGYWDFGTGNSVLGAGVINDYLYLLIKRADGTFIEKMSMALGANVGIPDSNGKFFDLCLDRRTTVTGTYNASPDDYTLFALPYTTVHANVRLIMGNSFDTPGALIDPTTYTFPIDGTVQVPGNFAGEVFAGEVYTQQFTFSEQFMTNANNVAVLSGRLTLRNWSVYFTDTAYFQVSVDPYGNNNPTVLSYVPANESTYTSLTVGESALEIGKPVFKSGSMTFGVFGSSKEAVVSILNDSPYPFCFTEGEWEADWTNRSRTA